MAVSKRFEWLCSHLICWFRFSHRILMLTEKIQTDSIEAACVSVTKTGKITLKYSEKFFKQLTDAMATYVIMHELMHIILHHCTSRQKHHFDKDSTNAELWNIAQDLAVNELIPETPEICVRPVIKDCSFCHVDEFIVKYPKCKSMKRLQNAEYYYTFLKEKDNKEATSNKTMDNHDEWKENGLASERVRQTVRKIDREQGWGNISAISVEVIRAAQIKRMNWRNLILSWFGLQKWRERRYTRKRPNRRTGFQHPGTRSILVDRWLIAADTSGSVDDELLSQWGGVVNQLAEEMPIDFMQFDCSTTSKPKPFERKMLDIEFKGRGGTSFQPVIDIVNDKHYKGVMILTDGEASAPTRPEGAKVLWVMPEGKSAPVEWGERVYLSY